MDIFLPESSLNHGRIKPTNANATSHERKTTRNDSVRNSQISCVLAEPIDLRMPTSRARFSDCAVLKFMKFMHASSNTKIPIVANSQTNCTLPRTSLPFSHSEYKCLRLIG